MLMVDGLDKYQNLRSTVTKVANSRFENNKACIIRGYARAAGASSAGRDN